MYIYKIHDSIGSLKLYINMLFFYKGTVSDQCYKDNVLRGFFCFTFTGDEFELIQLSVTTE